jgi:FdhE protein
MAAHLSQGLPLLPLVPPQLPVTLYFRDLAEYRALLARFQPELAGELADQGRALDGAAPSVRERLAGALLRGDTAAILEIAGALGVAPERLYFLGELALRPYLGTYAERLESVADFTGYHGGRCPVCGRQAHMGRIDADNLKHLHCPACEHSWRFGRSECANCGCTDAAQLGFFTVEGDDEHRVEHCGDCGHYLKVINQRIRARAVDVFVTDAATYHLDQLAETEGYCKGGRVSLSQ